MMLDTSATFDALVRAHAPDAERAERILANRFYRNIAGALSGTQEYMAAEKLHALHGDERFDVVVVDTPPSRHALDFLHAPGTLARFLDHPLFRLLMLPTRRGLRMLNVAAQPVLRTIGKVVGGDVLADAIAFFQAFEGMETGFRERADDVMAMLRSELTRYVLVASPKADTVEEALWFARRLRDQSLRASALVVNRATPVFGAPDDRPPPGGRRPVAQPRRAAPPRRRRARRAPRAARRGGRRAGRVGADARWRRARPRLAARAPRDAVPMTVRRTVPVEERRARLARRHGLAPVAGRDGRRRRRAAGRHPRHGPGHHLPVGAGAQRRVHGRRARIRDVRPR